MSWAACSPSNRTSHEKGAPAWPPARNVSVVSQPVLHYFRKKFLARKSTFAGRSASRRMKYGYHSSPKGT
jgi:hypothetical protein